MRERDEYQYRGRDIRTGMMLRPARGFTLVELMIVVVIISILAAIAYPSYLSQVRKSYRADAQADLMELASFMERYFTQNSTYVGATLPYSQTPRNGNARYTIAFCSGSPTATTYVLRTTAQSLGDQDQDPCGDMTISDTGEKKHTGSDTKCWGSIDATPCS